MKRLLVDLLVASAILLLIPGVRQSLAAPGDTPPEAITLTCGSPISVPPGASVWLAINNLPGYQVHLTLPQPPGGGLSFQVYSEYQAASLGTDHASGPMGRGTPLGGIAGADLNWEGGLRYGGTLYILVKNDSTSPAVVNFVCTEDGDIQSRIITLPTLVPPTPPYSTKSSSTSSLSTSSSSSSTSSSSSMSSSSSSSAASTTSSSTSTSSSSSSSSSSASSSTSSSSSSSSSSASSSSSSSSSDQTDCPDGQEYTVGDGCICPLGTELSETGDACVSYTN